MKCKTGKRTGARLAGTALALSLAVGGLIQPVGASTLQNTGAGTAYSETSDSILSARSVSASSTRLEYRLPGIVTRTRSALTTMTVVLNGKWVASGFKMNDTVYLPAEVIAKALGNVNVSYSTTTKTLTLSMSGLYMTATDCGYVTYANDRALFAFSPNVVMDDGRMYIPASTLTKALGINMSVSGTRVSLSGGFSPLLHASKYYREDEVYWLSKIISAESKGESLLGQIAVGDVILNRVKSPLYPNTIYSVIFDRKYGVQFSPTLDGSIYNDPTFTATLAAKICLEGTSLSDDALFFLNPLASQSSWIVRSREYAYSIGGHDFYL